MVFTANTVGEARAALHHYLNDGTEGDQLLCHVLNCNRARLYAHPEAVLAPAYRQHLTELLQKRLDGTPLAYLTSVCEFFSLEFEVTPAVLIPRAETETLVETALTLIPESTPDGAHVLDLGTGCGAIAIAIAHARPMRQSLPVTTTAPRSRSPDATPNDTAYPTCLLWRATGLRNYPTPLVTRARLT